MPPKTSRIADWNIVYDTGGYKLVHSERAPLFRGPHTEQVHSVNL